MKYLRMSILLLNLFLYCQVLFASPIPDHEINMNIIYQWARDPQTYRLNIQAVTLYNGFVKLTGVVPTIEQAGAIIAIAAKTPGVRCIDTSHLTLEYGKPLPPDVVLLAKVKGRLLRDNIFGNNEIPICIKVQKGIVYLGGTVADPRLIHTIKQHVRQVCGVKAIQSTIKIRSQYCAIQPVFS